MKVCPFPGRFSSANGKQQQLFQRATYSLNALAWAGLAGALVAGFTSATHAAPTTKAKIGQMIMVGFTGTSTRYKGVRAVMQELREGSIGGVMLMKHNIVSHRQLRQLTSALKQAAKSGGQMPPFIAVDQEGGAVQRLKFTRYPSARRIALKPAANAARIYGKLACELRASGINVNFGPVADLDLRGRANPIIGRMARSYGKSPERVIKYTRAFVAAHHRHGVMTAAKHFPGHGSSFKDSHKGFTAIPKWNRLGNELAPFTALANGSPEQRVDMMMIGHLYNKKWGAPASLSHTAVSGILRKQVGFNGIAITDDMEMGAIRKNYNRKSAIIRAVKAGNDVLLYANTITHARYLGRQIRDTIAGALCTGSRKTNCINPATIDISYQRISRLKNRQVATAPDCR